MCLSVVGIANSPQMGGNALRLRRADTWCIDWYDHLQKSRGDRLQFSR